MFNRTMPMRFVGIDLAWSEGNNTAASVLELSPLGKTARLMDYKERLESNEDIVEYVSLAASKGACIAVDAPIIVKNKSGARPVDREITSRFGRYSAGAHPCNLKKFPKGIRGARIVERLELYGILHNPYIGLKERRTHMRVVFEVYPHPAQVILFGLKERILYKKGGVEARRKGLRVLQDKIRLRLTRLEPRLELNAMLCQLCSKNPYDIKGKALKCFEDTLDSLICAYTAFYHWYWADERSEVLGDMESGYIVVPRTI